MKLIYMWIEKYNQLKDLSIAFSSEFHFQFRKETNEDILEISKREKNLTSFFDFQSEEKKRNIDFFGIVGENGTGKTTITNYINDDIFFNDYRGIYAFYDEINREIKVKIFYPSENIRIIRVEKKHSFYENIAICAKDECGTTNMFSGMKIYRGYFSNALNYVRDYQKRVIQENNYTISSNISKSKYDIRAYYSNEFEKQLALCKNGEKIKIGEKFCFSIPKKVKLVIPRWNRGDLKRNNTYLRKYDSVKKCNERSYLDYDSVDHMNRLAIIIFLSIQIKILWDKKDKDFEKIRIITKEELEEVCKSELSRSNIRWSVLLKEFLKRMSKKELEDLDIRTYLEDCNKLLDKCEKLDMTQSESKVVNIDDVVGEQGIFSLATRVSKEVGMSCLQFDWPLSSGEKAILSLLANIKEFSDKIPKYAKDWHILLVIDELDLYLHPTLQQDIISILIKYINEFFENRSIQVVFTTHSPLVLSDMPREKLLYLRKNADGKINVCNEFEDCKTFGANITSLYFNSFGMHSGSMGTYASNVIKKIIQLLQNTTNELTEQMFDEISNIISCVGDAVISCKLNEMLEKRRPQKSKLKEYYEKQVEYYTRKIKELERGND